MDIEGFTRAKINKMDEKSLENILAEHIKDYKNISDEFSFKMAQSVVEEVKNTLKLEKIDDDFLKDIVKSTLSDVKMGEIGVGSRGAGDFFVHRKIAEIVASTNTNSLINPSEQDDGGVVKSEINGNEVYITTAIDGIHSRLSEYPFLGGFHVTRASLRDVCVMGAKPVAIISDIHLADDGDVAKLFDFTAGVAAISELIDVPIVAGSTLRVGGDMVLGDRLVSAVGSIGVSNIEPTARKMAKPGDVILLTEGSGGGTITTTALYNGYFDVVWETIDISFIKASNALIKDDLIKDIHAMTDVTNGGLRGDAHEIASTTNLGLEMDSVKINSMVNPKVLNMLEKLDIDPLGVSTDSLMLIVPENKADTIKKSIKKSGVRIGEIGYVDDKKGARLIKNNNKVEEITPLFREAAYTKIKKLVGETTPEDFNQMQEKVEKSAKKAIQKKEKVINYIKNKDK
ncbi:MAG: hypothetical protein LBU40_06015 [Methanobrevibacter sp.]|jgi:hydrogenase expression/formation protein|nr:hypothetical protein [Methanobrevibacter sp.]